MAILAVADDFTGAAEIAGIGLRYGLTVRVLRGTCDHSGPKLTVIDTDSRHASAADASRRVRAILATTPRGWFDVAYKKIDSVLRGNVLAEARAAMDGLGRTRALLVPQNPSHDRKIRRGEYVIRDIPLHLTSFASDPEYPRRTSNVIHLLREQGAEPVQHLRIGAQLPDSGISIADGSWPEHLEAWADLLDPTVLPIGGVDFFEAILRQSGMRAGPTTFPGRVARGASLLICGSAAPANARTISSALCAGWPAFAMPDSLYKSNRTARSALTAWSDQIQESLGRTGRAVAFIDQALDPTKSAKVREHMAALAHVVVGGGGLGALLVEGGATAASVAARLGWDRFYADVELAPGVMRLCPDAAPQLPLILKPGSYEWPPSIWESSLHLNPSSAA